MEVPSITPWDFWEHKALQCGAPAGLAALGRQVMADWHLKGKDDGTLGDVADAEFMIDLCLNDPDEAERRFREALGAHPAG